MAEIIRLKCKEKTLCVFNFAILLLVSLAQPTFTIEEDGRIDLHSHKSCFGNTCVDSSLKESSRALQKSDIDVGQISDTDLGRGRLLARGDENIHNTPISANEEFERTAGHDKEEETLDSFHEHKTEGVALGPKENPEEVLVTSDQDMELDVETSTPRTDQKEEEEEDVGGEVYDSTEREPEIYDALTETGIIMSTVGYTKSSDNVEVSTQNYFEETNTEAYAEETEIREGDNIPKTNSSFQGSFSEDVDDFLEIFEVDQNVTEKRNRVKNKKKFRKNVTPRRDIWIQDIVKIIKREKNRGRNRKNRFKKIKKDKLRNRIKNHVTETGHEESFKEDIEVFNTTAVEVNIQRLANFTPREPRQHEVIFVEDGVHIIEDPSDTELVSTVSLWEYLMNYMTGDEPEIPEKTMVIEKRLEHPCDHLPGDYGSWTHRAQPTRVIVMGGGVAGLSALRTLNKLGLTDAVLIEASSRLGGRLHTVRHAEWMVEEGAPTIQGEALNPLYQLAYELNALGFPVLDIDWEDDVVTSDGGMQLPPIIEKGRRIFHQLQNDPRERAALKSFGDKALGDLLATRFDDMWGTTKDDKDKQAWMYYIHQKVSKKFGVNSWMNVAAKDAANFVDLGREYTWNGGMDGLIQYLLHEVSANQLRLSSPVCQVFWDIPSDDGSTLVVLADGTSYRARYVISALPVGVLKERHFATFFPPLPRQLTKALKAVDPGLVDRIALGWPYSWWGPKPFNQQVLWREYNFPHEMEWMSNIVEIRSAPHQPTQLEMEVFGDAAAAMENMDPETLIAHLVTFLRTTNRQYTVNLPTFFHRSKWHQNKWTQGSYQSYMNMDAVDLDVNDRSELRPDLTNSRGQRTLFFSGEHTSSDRFGTVDGALLSGVRAARWVMDDHAKFEKLYVVSDGERRRLRPLNDQKVKTDYFQYFKNPAVAYQAAAILADEKVQRVSSKEEQAERISKVEEKKAARKAAKEARQAAKEARQAERRKKKRGQKDSKEREEKQPLDVQIRAKDGLEKRSRLAEPRYNGPQSQMHTYSDHYPSSNEGQIIAVHPAGHLMPESPYHSIMPMSSERFGPVHINPEPEIAVVYVDPEGNPIDFPSYDYSHPVGYESSDEITVYYVDPSSNEEPDIGAPSSIMYAANPVKTRTHSAIIPPRKSVALPSQVPPNSPHGKFKDLKKVKKNKKKANSVMLNDETKISDTEEEREHTESSKAKEKSSDTKSKNKKGRKKGNKSKSRKRGKNKKNKKNNKRKNNKMTKNYKRKNNNNHLLGQTHLPVAMSGMPPQYLPYPSHVPSPHLYPYSGLHLMNPLPYGSHNSDSGTNNGSNRSDNNDNEPNRESSSSKSSETVRTSKESSSETQSIQDEVAYLAPEPPKEGNRASQSTLMYPSQQSSISLNANPVDFRQTQQSTDIYPMHTHKNVNLNTQGQPFASPTISQNQSPQLSSILNVGTNPNPGMHTTSNLAPQPQNSGQVYSPYHTSSSSTVQVPSINQQADLSNTMNHQNLYPQSTNLHYPPVYNYNAGPQQVNSHVYHPSFPSGNPSMTLHSQSSGNSGSVPNSYTSVPVSDPGNNHDLPSKLGVSTQEQNDQGIRGQDAIGSGLELALPISIDDAIAKRHKKDEEIESQSQNKSDKPEPQRSNKRRPNNGNRKHPEIEKNRGKNKYKNRFNRPKSRVGHNPRFRPNVYRPVMYSPLERHRYSMMEDEPYIIVPQSHLYPRNQYDHGLRKRGREQEDSIYEQRGIKDDDQIMIEDTSANQNSTTDSEEIQTAVIYNITDNTTVDIVDLTSDSAIPVTENKIAVYDNNATVLEVTTVDAVSLQPIPSQRDEASTSHLVHNLPPNSDKTLQTPTVQSVSGIPALSPIPFLYPIPYIGQFMQGIGSVFGNPNALTGVTLNENNVQNPEGPQRAKLSSPSSPQDSAPQEEKKITHNLEETSSQQPTRETSRTEDNLMSSANKKSKNNSRRGGSRKGSNRKRRPSSRESKVVEGLDHEKTDINPQLLTLRQPLSELEGRTDPSHIDQAHEVFEDQTSVHATSESLAAIPNASDEFLFETIITQNKSDYFLQR